MQLLSLLGTISSHLYFVPSPSAEGEREEKEKEKYYGWRRLVDGLID
jgi:hypothetical protein